MADDIYIINDLAAPGGSTVTVTDDGIGIDWLVLTGTYSGQSNITLSSRIDDGLSIEASGTYFDVGGGNRLLVEGFIENVRGSDSSDFIQGNEGANRLLGDQRDSGVGGADVIWGADGNDVLFGGAGADQLRGDEDDDRLFGGRGIDDLGGGSGVDILSGGGGADTLSGGANIGDTVAYRDSRDGVRVQLTFGSATVGKGGDAEGDSIAGFTDIWGSDFDDVLIDTVEDAVAFGGNDSAFWGFAGADTMRTAGGNDRAFGGDGADRLYGGAGGDNLFGGAQDDQVYGGDGFDQVVGGGGDDVLVGGLGADELNGGKGADTFRFTSVEDSAAGAADWVIAFNGRAGDRVDLRAIDADSGTDGNQRFDYIAGDDFGLVAGQLRWDAELQTLQGDVDGDGAADFELLLIDVTDLLGSDLIR